MHILNNLIYNNLDEFFFAFNMTSITLVMLKAKIYYVYKYVLNKTLFLFFRLEVPFVYCPLHWLLPYLFRCVVNFVYSGKLQINHENALDVLMAASHLQMPAVLKLVSKFYKHNLSLGELKSQHHRVGS